MAEERPIESLSDAEFLAAKQEQNAYLWRQWEQEEGTTLHTVFCKRCGTPVFRLVQLRPYRVVLAQATKPNQEPIPEGMSAAELGRYWPSRKRSTQLANELIMFPIGDDEPRDRGPTLFIGSACECSSRVERSLAWLLDRAKAGPKSRIEPPRRPSAATGI